MIQLKLSNSGEIRRLTFPSRPSWSELGTKVADLAGVPSRDIAVSYDDGVDVITMSTQEELDDYFDHCYRDSAKLTVVIKANSAHGKSAEAYYDDFEDDVEDIGQLGPTMVIQMDDGGYRMLDRIPEVDEDNLSQRFVEIASDTGSQKMRADEASPSLSARQVRQKDMDFNTPHVLGSKSTSSASIVDNDYPTKTPVHIYAEVPDISEQDDGYNSAGGPNTERLMGSFGTVYPIAPPPDALKPIPNAGQYPTYHSETAMSASARSPVTTPRHMPSLDLENPTRNADTSGSRTPTLRPSALRPSFVEDVGYLVEGLSRAFASHPELSEGLRNIVKKAIGGEYWEAESARVATAAENVRAAARETSGRINSAAQNMSLNAERDTVRVIAEALGGVFRVISELSASPDGPSGAGNAPRSTPRDGHRAHRHDSHSGRGARADRHRDHRPGPDQYVNTPYRPVWHGPLPAPYIDRPHSWAPGPWDYSHGYGPGPYGYVPPGEQQGSHYDEHEEEREPNIHDTKKDLEALKEEYRAGKERFKKQKEERRKIRKETAERRAEGREQIKQNGTIREETIVARMPLRDSSGGRKKSYAEVYALRADDNLRSSTSSRPPIAVPPPRGGASDTVLTPSVRASELTFVPPPPPVAPNPLIGTPRRHIPDIVPPPPPPPPMQMQESLSTQPYRPGTMKVPDTSRMDRAASEGGPTSWPLPPRDSGRAHLATVRDRLMARLFEMGIQTRPNVVEVVNRYTERDENANEEDLLPSILNAINIRGTPSPRIPEHQRRR